MRTSTAERFVTDNRGKRVAVLLDLKTYERMREAQDELADIRAYDGARRSVDAEMKTGKFATLAQYRARRTTRGK
jgi:PHD/YefM family antitoxin component YafN of YafNO toxin-antitoxin module